MNPILALIIANIIWGAASPIFKYALTNIPPFTLAFIRFYFASFIFVPFIKMKDIKKLKKIDWFEIILGSAFFGIFINITFFFLGLQRSQSINAPIISSTGPIIIFILSVVFLREKLEKKVLLGMVISLLGALLIIFSPIIFDGKKLADLKMVEGNIMFMLATLGSVACPLIIKNVLKKTSPMLVTFVGFFFAAVMFAPLMIGELGSWSLSSLNMAGIVGIIFGVFFSSALGYFLFTYGLSKIKTQEVGIFTYIDPVIAVIIAIPLLGEYPNLYFLIGSTLVFLGIYIAEKRLHYHPVHKLKNKNR